MKRESTPATRKAAIAAYVETASAYATRAADYRTLDAARGALARALDYERVHDHLGEFCNLHERDLPNWRNASLTADGHWRYSGWASPVTTAERARLEAIDVARDHALRKWFESGPVARFLAGASVNYLNDGEGFRAGYARGRIMIDASDGFLGWIPLETGPATREEAAEFFESVAEYAWFILDHGA